MDLSSACHQPLVVMSAGSRTEVTSRPMVGIDQRMQIDNDRDAQWGAANERLVATQKRCFVRSALRAGAVTSRSPGGAGCER